MGSKVAVFQPPACCSLLATYYSLLWFSECAGFAREPAKLADQVQFLARTLLKMTLELDGTAIGCNPIEVGSTPTGVSDRPTAGSDYIFL